MSKKKEKEKKCCGECKKSRLNPDDKITVICPTWPHWILKTSECKTGYFEQK